MRVSQCIVGILLCLPLASGAAEAETNAPVVVWYEDTYVTKADGMRMQKVETIPWAEDLTVIRAIAAAGGYSTPPVRATYLVRDGRSTLLPDPRQMVVEKDVMRLKPGDRIELRKQPSKSAVGSPRTSTVPQR